MIADEIGYFIFEEPSRASSRQGTDPSHVHVLLDQSQSEYLWWHKQGLAGCVLRPHLRQRLGVTKANAHVHASLFKSQEEIA